MPATARNTAKPLSEGRDELNIIRFPLSVLSKNAGNQSSLTYTDEAWDEGANQWLERQLTINSSPEYGLPTDADEEVLIALFSHAKQQDDYADPTVHFKPYDLLEILGWKTVGKNYERLERALMKWTHVTLTYKHAWWEKNSQRWTTTAFNMLDNVTIHGKKGRYARDELPLSSYTFGKVIFKSLREGYIKKLDLDLFRELSSPTAKRLYRVLDKHFHQSPHIKLDLHTLAHKRLGLSENYKKPSQLISKLEPAVQQLEAQGYIVTREKKNRFVNKSRGRYNVHFEKSGMQRITNVEAQSQSEPTGIISELIKHGIPKRVATKLSTDHDDTYIESKIELLEWQLSHSKNEIESPGGYLRTAIEQDFQPPKSFKSKADRAASKAKSEARKQKLREQEVEFEKQRAAKDADAEKRVADFIATLSDGQKFALERKAIQKASGFMKDRFFKARDKKPDVEQETKAMIIHAYVLDLLDQEDEPFELKRAS